MAYEYDRYEREDGGGSFLMGLLAGTVLGAGLGMLFAPKAGNELRSQLNESAGRLKTTANDAYHQASDKVSQMVDRGKDAYQRARTGEDIGHEGIGSSGMGTGAGSSGTSGSGTSGTLGNTGSNYSGAGSTFSTPGSNTGRS